MKNYILLIISPILLLVFISGSCNTSSKGCYQDYKFTVPITLYPANDTFQIGDTIWLESEITNLFFDSLSKEFIDLNSFEPKIYSGLHKIDEIQNPDAETTFNYINKKGGFYVLNSGAPTQIQIKYTKDFDSVWRLKVGCIPTIKGLFNITFFIHSDDYYTEKGIVQKDCTESFVLRFSMNNRKDNNNYHLLIGYPNINSSTGFKNEGEYAFWVID